jgi:iron complex transport system substrate-binding protein
MPCGFNLHHAQREMERYSDVLEGLAPRVLALDASAYFSRSGPRVAEGIERLASAILAT